MFSTLALVVWIGILFIIFMQFYLVSKLSDLLKMLKDMKRKIDHWDECQMNKVYDIIGSLNELKRRSEDIDERLETLDDSCDAKKNFIEGFQLKVTLPPLYHPDGSLPKFEQFHLKEEENEHITDRL